MSEETVKSKCGRKKGEVRERGFIKVTDKIRMRIESDCLILEELTGNEKEAWGNNKYYTSWSHLFDKLVKMFTADKVSKKNKEYISFNEARVEILSSIKELKNNLLSEIDRELNSASKEIVDSIKKFAR